jgi:AcrR family transcriptional regulator
MAKVGSMAGRAKTKQRPAATTPARPGAIRRRNVAKILKAAETVFAQKGFSGASTAEIARLAGVPKPNLHYYFRTKQALYESLLDRILAMWMDAMDELHPGADPAEALSRYVARKIDLSRRLPGPSRLWAMEMLAGAPHIGGFLRGRVRELVNEKSALALVFHHLGRDPDLCRFRGANDRGDEPQDARRRILRRGARHADVADPQRAGAETVAAPRRRLEPP